jgi:hypothetical protein
MIRKLLIAAALLAAAPACAQDRDYCPARPGLGDAACTVDPGRVSLEVGAAAWDHDPGSDTITIGDTVARIGIGPSTEFDIGWTAYVHARERTGAAIDRSSGVGDVTLALRQNLHNPDGSGFTLALEPFVSLPTGSGPGGAGTWGAGLIVPMGYDLGHGLSLQSTSEFDAAPDADRHGRHASISEVIGLGIDLTEQLSATAEVQGVRDWDPSGHSTQSYAALALAWMAGKDLQLDIGGAAGLNRAATDLQLYAGISHRF